MKVIGIVILSVVVLGALLKESIVAKYWRYKHPSPRIMQFHSVLGWQNKPGIHTAKYYKKGRLYPISMHIGPSGQRLHSRSNLQNPVGEVVGIGGSFAFGWAVNDQVPYLAKLAELIPSLHFVNLGVGGYGTYQSILALKQYYENRPKPKVVVYGFGTFHEERNVAGHHWQSVLFANSWRGHSTLPHVRLNNQGKLDYFPPQKNPFGHSHLCKYSISLCGWYFRYFIKPKIKPDPPDTEALVATQLLFKELQSLANEMKSHLIVVMMDIDGYREHQAFLERQNIDHIVATRWRSLPYDSHPNERFHQHVAQALSKRISRILLNVTEDAAVS